VGLELEREKGIELQLYPVVRSDFIVELLHEKAFSDLGSGL